MKRFNENDDKNGIKRILHNYTDNLIQQKPTSSSSTSQDIIYSSPPLSKFEFYNGVTTQSQLQPQQPQQQKQQQQQQQQSPQSQKSPLNKDQQFKYPAVPMYPPPSLEQSPASYYGSYYNNPNWRYTSGSTTGTTLGGSSFTYDPSQPPPPIPKLNSSLGPETSTPPPLPPLPPPGDPSYFSSPPLSIKSPIPVSSVPPIQPSDNQTQQPPPPFPPIDTSHGPPPPHHPSNVTNNASRRPLLTRGPGVYRGVGGVPGGIGRGGDRNIMKRTTYPFKKTKVPFNKIQPSTSSAISPPGPSTQMNGQQKKPVNKSQTNLRNNVNDGDDDGDDNLSHIQVNKKAKRKPMSTRYPRKIEWDRGDALKALALEKEYNKLQRNSMLILKFPDPELSKNTVKEYSPFIESVHFQQPSTPRYCFVQLKDGVDIEKVREELCQIPFGVGKIVAERKRMHSEEDDTVNPEDIDPYTLYIGNLPTTITVKTVKEHFPNSRRIDIGYAQRMRYTRYAFIRYETVEDAMEAYRNTFNLLIESRSLIVRFRRQKGNVGLPGESRPSNPKKDATNQNKKQTGDSSTAAADPNSSDVNNASSTSSINIIDDLMNQNDSQDDDLYYICGDPSKFNMEDSKEHVFEESRLLSEQKQESISSDNNSNNYDNPSIKQEPMEDYDDDDIDDDDDDIDDDDDDIGESWFESRVKIEPPEEQVYPVVDLDNENDDDDDGNDNPDHCTRKLNDKDEKPDIKSLPVPFPIFNDNSQKLLGRSSYMSRSFLTNNGGGSIQENDRDRSLFSRKKTSYRDGLDELFDRMNSEDDDLTF